MNIASCGFLVSNSKAPVIVYYAYFDYWGKGTKVTVSSAEPSAPKSIFGLSQCSSDSEFLTIGCVSGGFSPADFLTFTWKDPANKAQTDFVQYPAFGSGEAYTKISHLSVKKSEWNPQTSYTCEASNSKATLKATITRPAPPPEQPATVYLTVPTKKELENGKATFLCLAQKFLPKTYSFKWFMDEKQVTNEINTYDASEKNGSVTLYSATSILQIRAEEWKTGAKIKCEFEHLKKKQDREAEYTAKLTLTLKPPIESELFVNNTVVLQAVVSGDEKKVKEASVSCKVKNEDVTLRSGSVTFSQDISQYIKIHRIIVDTNKWFNGETVTCTIRDRDIKQEIHCDKGDEKTPNVTIYRPDSNKDTDQVSLVCEVTSPKLGDIYIMWKVGEKSREATTSFPIHRKSSTSVLSILTVSKQEYEDPRTTITCAVKHAKKGNISAPLQVSTSQREPPEPEKGFALNCNKDVLEEDEFRSLWSTATSFIFLFLFSLTYSAVLSLLRVTQISINRVLDIYSFLQMLGHISQYLGHFCKNLHTVSTTEVYVG
ncbi:Ig mu chain C region membrane-bound form [Anabarilius grahami]|uniref:Ig mu chain C region membrane-bound form n=1 Tax=Anabarilius grahami TaxID=495550 RepID=A0A3N0Z236_ANAGA|nr:Ig mu chain C region membrane-bound form [Anabarilius grahami]